MYILAIDQGTSSTKALLFDQQGKVVKKATADLHTDYYSDGRVEQRALDIIKSVEKACADVLQGVDKSRVSCIGISNQRETFVLWDKNGNPIYPAVVWACKRSNNICEKIKAQEPWLNKKTGLIIDPYFSGTKLLWILENEPEIKPQIDKGEVYFGTVDTWLLYTLTKGKEFATDHTNASRTLFFNIKDLQWDAEILQKWQLENLKLAEVKSSSAFYGKTDLFALMASEIPITAMIGDSHAAMFGETCFEKGETKMTLGTGCSMLMHVGNQPKASTNGLLSTIGWSTDDTVAYAWEGAIVACGSMIEWLKSLNIIAKVEETEAMANEVAHDSEVFLVPGFSGLGAPFWQMDRKASFHGITFGTTNEHIVAATLETICFQIKAVIDAMEGDLGHVVPIIAMHGGLSKNKFVKKGLAELLSSTISIQQNLDVSAQGAAFLAGLSIGIFRDLRELKSLIAKKELEENEKSNTLTNKFQHWLTLIQQEQ